MQDKYKSDNLQEKPLGQKCEAKMKLVDNT